MQDSVQYFSSLSQILIFLVAGFAFLAITLLVSRILRPNRPNVEKLSSYESGEEPRGGPWVPFNLRFYVIAIIFLLFEVEIVFLFPWAIIFSDEKKMVDSGGTWGTFLLAEMISFIIVLGIGLAYAWRHGHLEWLKPSPKSTSFKSPVPKELYDRINERYK